MMNFVSANTALDLQNAGFPQPDFAVGQIWYDNGGSPFFIYNTENRAMSFVWLNTNSRMASTHMTKDDIVYAPTATDILQQIGVKYRIEATDGDILDYKGPVFWINGMKDIDEHEPSPIFAPNLVEALAASWLSLKASGCLPATQKCYKTGEVCFCSGLCRESF